LRSVRTLVVCSLLAGALTLPVAAPALGAGAVGPKLIAKINHARKRHGAGALRVSPALTRSSHRYACRMLRRNYFGHMAHVSAPRRFNPSGEALAMTSGLGLRWRVAYSGWMHSSAHRSLLLSRRFRWVGIGSCRGHMGSRRSVTWVVHVGRL
jgi:uncharacterized protein YkwD